MKRPILLILVLPFVLLDVAKSRAIRLATRLGWGHP
jgi:hypothetical protein